MKVIFIGSDRNIFKKGSAARARMVEYGTIFDELHIVVFVKKNFQFPVSNFQKISNFKFQISENTWIYPTRSWCRWFYPFGAARIAKKIISGDLKLSTSNWVISAQDPFEAGLAAKWASGKTGAKLHIQIHTDFLSPFFKRQSLLNILRVFIARRILRRADGIRVVSKRISDSLTSHFKIKTSNLSVLPIFVDKEKFAQDNPYNFRTDHPNWTFVVLSVGRLETEKNFELAIRAMKIVCRKYPRTGLVITGNGRGEKRLPIIADLSGLSKNISFVTDPKARLPGFYKGANLYLQTSNYEGFGLAAAEAAYAGLPAVLTDVGAAGWLFKDGENAKICPVGGKKCLAEAIINLIENNGLRERIRSSLGANFGKELPQTKIEYLGKYKESIESCFSLPKSAV